MKIVEGPPTNVVDDAAVNVDDAAVNMGQVDDISFLRSVNIDEGATVPRSPSSSGRSPSRARQESGLRSAEPAHLRARTGASFLPLESSSQS